MSDPKPLLDVRQLRVAYGGIHAVRGIDLQVGRGELVCLIGANGAGKTTTLKALTGLQPVHSGEIHYQGRRVDALPAWRRVTAGLVMVPEGRGVFARMSIEENLLMGAYLRKDAEVGPDLESVYTLFTRLRERRHQLAGTLSGGEQQMLAMGRAMMARPELLLLDEPSMGLSPIMVDTLFDTIGDITRRGVSVLLVEQNATRALEIAQRGYVMDSGEITVHGAAADLLNDPRIQQAYLGL
jgi:branched-chain amino acid transport system ATP-binding protein